MQHGEGISDWQTSNLVHPETGLIGKKLNDYVIVPAELKLIDDQFLYWTMGAARTKKVRHNTLDEFLALTGRSADQILRYAKKWGALHVNRHPGATSGRESIDEWLFLSERAGAIVSLASALKAGLFGDRAMWSVLGMLDEKGTDQASQLALDRATRYEFSAYLIPDPEQLRHGRGFSKFRIRDILAGIISREISDWLRIAGVAVENRYMGSRSPTLWEVAVTSRTRLLGALALQLAFAVCGSTLRNTCASCGKIFSRKRKPSRAHAQFCQNCGRRAAVRQAESRRREKIKEASRLASNGMPVPIIAKTLNTKPATVRRWLFKEKGG